ncbi:MAG: dihydrodipicolinate synthase family protein [Chitinophagaceae bacterium]|nr:dihydrodipicolinate synthase family protein [Chitinophagaceae bacterium]
MPVIWKGVMPAVTTKFDENGDVVLPAFEKNLKAQIDAGVSALILGGTLGESSVLEVTEKKLLVDTALVVAEKRVPVILNIAEGSLREALRQTALAEEWGAEGLMVLPPMRYKSDHRETVHWYKTIAKSTSLPILVYNNPVDYKTEITLDMFAEFAELENIQAVKESTRDVTNVTRMKNRFGDRFKILCGVDTLAMEELVLGADGLVAGLVCAFPAETVWLYKLVKQGRIKEATALYRWFMPLLELDIHPKLVQYIKLAESVVGLGTEHVREPRLPLTGEERERVLKIIKDAVASRPGIPESLVADTAQ